MPRGLVGAWFWPENSNRGKWPSAFRVEQGLRGESPKALPLFASPHPPPPRRTLRWACSRSFSNRVRIGSENFDWWMKRSFGSLGRYIYIFRIGMEGRSFPQIERRNFFFFILFLFFLYRGKSYAKVYIFLFVHFFFLLLHFFSFLLIYFFFLYFFFILYNNDHMKYHKSLRFLLRDKGYRDPEW